MFADAAEVVAHVNSCGALDFCEVSNDAVDAAEPLSGGVANVVYRLHLRQCADSKAPTQLRTAVFKFYPPRLRSNDAVAFSQARYFVEKAALLALADGKSAVRVPRVLYTDDALKFIIMEDIGAHCVSLMDYFSSGNSTAAAPEQLAGHLAAFLAALYAKDVTQLPACFHNTAAWDVLDRQVHQRFEANLGSLGVLPDLSGWLPRVRPAREPRDYVLIMGDLWPNSLYIDPSTHEMWLLDWEMARFGSPLSDTRQMLVNLFVMEQTPTRFRTAHVERFRKALVRGVVAAVGQAPAEAEQADFMVLLAAIVGNEFWRCEDAGGVMRAASACCERYLGC